MKVLVVTHVFPRWQNDTQAVFLLDWAKALVHSGVDVRVLAPHDAGAAECEVLEGIPVRRVRYGIDSWEQVAYRGNMHNLVKSPTGLVQLAAMSARTILAIKQAVKTFKPDVVHVHWWLPSLLYIAKANINVPTVVHMHGTDMRLTQGSNMAGLLEWASTYADRVEAVSLDLANQASRVLKDRPVAVNTMPVNERYIRFLSDLSPAEQADYVAGRPPTSDENIITGPLPNIVEEMILTGSPVFPSPEPTQFKHVLAVGRLVKDKGFLDLVHAVSLLKERVLLRIVGEGPLRQELAHLAAELGVELELPGTIPQAEMMAQYEFADVVVQPSHGEGFGMVAAEAALCYRPVVATDTAGAQDCLPWHTLVPIGDITKLSEAIALELSNPNTRLALDTARSLRETLSPMASCNRTIVGWKAAISEFEENRKR